jgi:hypothetical protein
MDEMANSGTNTQVINCPAGGGARSYWLIAGGAAGTASRAAVSINVCACCRGVEEGLPLLGGGERADGLGGGYTALRRVRRAAHPADHGLHRALGDHGFQVVGLLA